MNTPSSIERLIVGLRQSLQGADDPAGWSDHLSAELGDFLLSVLPVPRRPGWVRFDLDVLSVGLGEPGERREALTLLHRINHASLAQQPWRACIDEDCMLSLTATIPADALPRPDIPAFLDDALHRGRQLLALWASASSASKALTEPAAGQTPWSVTGAMLRV